MVESTKKKKMHPAWLMLIACCFLQIGGMGALKNTVGIMIAGVISDLHFAQGPFMLYITIQCIVMAICLPFAGRIMAKVNIRVLVTVSAIVVAACYAAMGTFSEVWQWYIAGVVGGVFSFFCFIVTPVILSNWFSAKVGLVMGIAMACTSLSGAILSPVAQMLIQSVGWRSTYMILAVIGLACILPFSLFVLRFKPADMGLAPYGAEEAAAARAANGDTSAPAAIEGVSQKTAMKSLAFVCLFAFAGVLALVSSFMQLFPTVATLGGMAGIAGVLASATMIGGLVGKFFLGWLNDTIGARNCTFVGSALGIVSIGLLAFSILNANSVTMIVAGALFGVYAAMGTVNNPLLVGEAFGKKEYAGIFAFITSATTLLGGFGVTIIGITHDAFGSYNPAIYGMVVLCVVGAVLVAVGVSAAKKLPRDA